jgi:outer membrane protein insertion porin family
VELDVFTDAGIDGALRKSQLQLDSAAVNLLHEEYPNPDFPNLKISQQIQVAPGTNFTPRVSSGIQIVVQLPIVHAPFRFYYAYNISRLTDTIVQPRGAFFLSDETKAALPPGVYTTQILPQLNTILDHQAFRIPSSLFEPKSMYRFTVSRTF